jgi:tetratricopeptide (TPR) repeat protein
MFKAFAIYLRLLVLPCNLCVEHTVLFPDSIFDVPTIISILIFVTLFFIMIKIRNSKYKLFSLGIAWFFINFLPVSNLVPANYIVAERYMYVPSLGFCLILAYALLLLVKPDKWRYLFLAVIISIYCGLAIFRNAEWRDEYTLWSKTVRQSPNSVIARNNLGTEYVKMGKYDKAISEYEKAFQIYPKFENAYFNLIMAYVGQATLNEADFLLLHGTGTL